MPSCFIEVPIPWIHEDERFPDRDVRQIYPHLKHYCSKFFPLPAIEVGPFRDGFVVTHGHKYVRIARELGYPWLRAIYRTEYSDPQQVLDTLPQGVRVTPRELLEREAATLVAREYHVYFFSSPLASPERDRFLSDIAGFFERLETSLIDMSQRRLLRWDFPFSGECAEFEALIPVGDPRWFSSYLDICRRFSREVRRIVSFQGKIFPELAPENLVKG